MSVVLARAQFLQWVKDTHPQLFRGALKYAESWREGEADRQGNPGTVSGLGEVYDPSGAPTGVVAPTNFWQQFATGITALGTAYLGYKGQKNVLEMNLQRAQAGLPPIDPVTGAPTVRTSVSLSPEIMARLNDTGATLQKVILWGGLGFLGYMLIRKVAR